MGTKPLDSRSGPPSSAEPARRGFFRRHRRLVIVVVVVTLVVVVVAPVGFGALLWSRLDRVDVEMPGSAPGATTYLIAGSDSRAAFQTRQERLAYGGSDDSPGEHADMILLLRVPDDGSRATLMSVPRDLLVVDDNNRPSRLGLLYDRGLQLFVNTLCAVMGVGVDHVVVIDFLAFEAIVNAVGGVEVDAAVPTRDLLSGLRIPAGTSHLGGARALAYVRSRHIEERRGGVWVPASDGAAARQAHARAALTQIGAQIPSLADPVDLARLGWAVSGAVRVDNGLGIGEIRDLADGLRNLGGARELVLPVSAGTGEVPVATMLPGAAEMLQRFTGPRAPGARCSEPSLPAAR